jgi:transposase-like protein
MEIVSMSYEELDRVGVIERVIEKRLTQAEAARILGLTSRQVRRLRRAYERGGPRVRAPRTHAMRVPSVLDSRDSGGGDRRNRRRRLSAAVSGAAWWPRFGSARAGAPRSHPCRWRVGAA